MNLPTHTPKAALATRSAIFELERVLAQIPGATHGDTEACPLSHYFAESIYVREIFIPRGYVLTGKIHKFAHPNFLMQGAVIVVTEQHGREYLRAPLCMISPPGTKRAVVALEDTIWVTVHHNPDNETDLQKIEDSIIAKDYEALKLVQDTTL